MSESSQPPAFEPDRERWNARFGQRDYVFGTAPNVFLAAQAFRFRAGMTALCVADGEGRNSVWLARQGMRVTAFDFSEAGIAKARGHPTDEARDLLAIFADSQLAMYAAQSACRSRSALRRDLPGGARQRGVST